MRGTATVIVVAGLGAGGVFGVGVWRGRASDRPAKQDAAASTTAASSTVATLSPSVGDTTLVQPGNAQLAAVAMQPESATVVATAVPTAAPAPASTPVAAKFAAKPTNEAPFEPVLAEGQTVLPRGIIAVRNDSVVTLSFDKPMTRTRIPEKFEQLLRTTLPKVYGPAIDTVLSKLPSGDLSNQGNLVSELPTRGIRVPVKDAWTLAVYPETRPGQDGPLVVRYRVMVVSKN